MKNHPLFVKLFSPTPGWTQCAKRPNLPDLHENSSDRIDGPSGGQLGAALGGGGARCQDSGAWQEQREPL